MSTSSSCSLSQVHQISFIILIVCSFLFFFAISESVYFEFTDFVADQTNIVYSGDAKPSGGAIEFNRVNKSVYRVAHTVYADAVQIWDRKSGKLSSFTTHFTFIIETQPSITPGHGLAFFLAPVDFQIPPNSDRWDPGFPHVGINKNWLGSANSTAWNASLHSGDPADAWVSYSAATQMLTVSWRYVADNTSRENTSLSYQVDLREVLPEWVTIGFSAATGRAIERHILKYWQFNSSLNIDDGNEDNAKKRKLAVGLTVPLGVLVVGGIWVWDSLGKGQLLSCVDQKLRMEFVMKEVECLMMVGLWCAHPDPSLRPSIRQAIQVLKFEAALPSIPIKMPVAMYYAPEVGFSSGTMTNSSIDLVR
ncbi:hypothetical protein L1887_40711 [Cichorium endivia]|nr:hypothetical protein L1887_40711 [Cichorium endivia]